MYPYPRIDSGLGPKSPSGSIPTFPNPTAEAVGRPRLAASGERCRHLVVLRQPLFDIAEAAVRSQTIQEECAAAVPGVSETSGPAGGVSYRHFSVSSIVGRRREGSRGRYVSGTREEVKPRVPDTSAPLAAPVPMPLKKSRRSICVTVTIPAQIARGQ